MPKVVYRGFVVAFLLQALINPGVLHASEADISSPLAKLNYDHKIEDGGNWTIELETPNSARLAEVLLFYRTYRTGRYKSVALLANPLGGVYQTVLKLNPSTKFIYFYITARTSDGRIFQNANSNTPLIVEFSNPIVTQQQAKEIGLGEDCQKPGLLNHSGAKTHITYKKTNINGDRATIDPVKTVNLNVGEFIVYTFWPDLGVGEHIFESILYNANNQEVWRYSTTINQKSINDNWEVWNRYRPKSTDPAGAWTFVTCSGGLRQVFHTFDTER